MAFRRALSFSAVTLVLALAFVVPARARLLVDRQVLPADGRSTARARAVATSWLGVQTVWAPRVRPSIAGAEAQALGLTWLYAADGTLVVRAGQRAGRVPIRLGNEQVPLSVELDARDSDGDGLPDAAELSGEGDKAAFTAWFTAIAEAQATHLDDAWAKVHRDCAGLVRFAFREALKRHDRAWLERRRFLPSVDAPDVGAFRYPELPFIGERPFRATPGPFDPRLPIEVQVTAAPSARSLWQLNSVLISRDLSEARAGDLLFFSVPYAAGSRMHTMIVLGARPGSTQEARGARVVYHTGGDEGGEAPAGEVRLISLEDLFLHPDSGWHPVADNPRFLGVHRLIHMDAGSWRPHGSWEETAR